ncbi:MAG: PAS domain-containing hybrid sensor histidine kinase/response regulator [Thermodesulfobacteriota bacterium]
MDRPPSESGPARRTDWLSDPLRITLIYLLLGGLWIILSDAVLEKLVADQETCARLQTYKGWFYVLMTAGLIYALVAGALARRRQAEEALRQGLTGYRRLAESISDAFLALNQHLHFIYWNRACEELTGRTAEEVLGRGFLEVFPDERGGPLEQLLRRVLERRRPETMRVEMAVKPGDRRHLELSAYPAEDGVSLVTRDLTEQRQGELERQRLAAAMDQAGEAVVISDLERRVVYLNPAFERMVGHGRDEMLGRPITDFLSDRDDEIVQRVVVEGNIWHGRLTHRRKGGECLAEATISPVRDRQGRVVNYVRVERDVTDQVALEEQLRRSQKMEAIGTLAGGVAHDFNNILAAMMGYTELALSELDPAGEAAGHLGEVLKAGERARDLVQQILAFSRQAEQAVRPTDLAQVVAECLRLLKATLPSTIKLTHSSPPRPVVVKADPSQLSQVVMNLCANAAQALQGVGEVAVAVRTLALESPPEGLDLPPGQYALLTVSDNGPGVDPAIAERIFDPFFTTKEIGHGTGLGLAVVHGVARDCGGGVRLAPAGSGGASFEVYLPLLDQPPEAAAEPPEPQVRGGDERVLVVDDEPALRRTTSLGLTRLGYRVTALASALDALAIIRDDPAAFDLVISDQTMPGMTGLELARRLRQLRPDLPVILTTGHSEQVTSQSLNDSCVAGLVMKPASLARLAAEMRRILEARPPAGD